jgi:hypothetical protein
MEKQRDWTADLAVFAVEKLRTRSDDIRLRARDLVAGLA